MNNKQIAKIQEVFTKKGLNVKEYQSKANKATKEVLEQYTNEVLDAYKLDFSTKECVEYAKQLVAYKTTLADVQAWSRHNKDNSKAYINMCEWTQDKKDYSAIESNEYWDKLARAQIKLIESSLPCITWAKDVRNAIVSRDYDTFVEVMSQCFKEKADNTSMKKTYELFTHALSTANKKGITIAGESTAVLYVLGLILAKVEKAQSLPEYKTLLTVGKLNTVAKSLIVISQAEWENFKARKECNTISCSYILELVGIEPTDDDAKNYRKAVKCENKLLIKPQSLYEAEHKHSEIVKKAKEEKAKAKEEKAEQKTEQ